MSGGSVSFGTKPATAASCWDLDSDPAWYAPISPATTYKASIWVRADKTVAVDLNMNLLNATGDHDTTVSSTKTTLAANTWTQLTLTSIKPAPGEAYAAIEPHFTKATTGTVIYWDDMSLTGP
jgi:hypothetical protein